MFVIYNEITDRELTWTKVSKELLKRDWTDEDSWSENNELEQNGMTDGWYVNGHTDKFVIIATDQDKYRIFISKEEVNFQDVFDFDEQQWDKINKGEIEEERLGQEWFFNWLNK